MNRTLWAIYLVTAVCIGYLLGYSVPPMIEAGMIGGGSADAVVEVQEAESGESMSSVQPDPAETDDTDAATLEYYRKLQQIGSQ